MTTKAIKLTDNEVKVCDVIQSGNNTLTLIAETMEKHTIAVRGLLGSLEKKGCIESIIGDTIAYSLTDAGKELRISSLKTSPELSKTKYDIPVNMSEPSTIVDSISLSASFLVNNGTMHELPFGTKIEEVNLVPVKTESSLQMLDSLVNKITNETVAAKNKSKKNVVEEVEIIENMWLINNDGKHAYKVLEVFPESNMLTVALYTVSIKESGIGKEYTPVTVPGRGDVKMMFTLP